MKQKIVIKVSMPCERSRSKAMALAARADGTMSIDLLLCLLVAATALVSTNMAGAGSRANPGVISMGITGDARDRLEVVGDGVDPVCLVSCLRRKLGHAEILQVEEVKEKKPEEPTATQPVAVHPLPQWYPGHYYHHHPPPRMVVCEEPSNCPIM